jgi:hypothetical protein
MNVYIVRRESADSREEIDVFEGTPVGYELATAWAHLIGSDVEEESHIDTLTLATMVASWREADGGTDDDGTGLDAQGYDNDGNRREYL